MLLTSSDAPVYSDASSLIDNTDEISRYDSSTARVSALSFPLEALSKNTQSFYLPIAFLEVAPNGKKFAAPSGIIQSLRCRYKASPKIIYVVEDDVKDIFGHILHYLHSGDYSVLIPAADKSSYVACEDEIDIATQDLLPLKENYFASHKDI